MLRKLLKYDLKWCYKPIVVFYILALFFSIVTRILESIDQSFIILILDKICSGIVIAMIANILINNFLRVWVRVIRNVYKDESYLTHTLPVSKNLIYTSKVLTSIITLITSFIVIIVCLAICCLNKDTWLILKNSLEESAIFFNSSVFGLISVLIMTIFFEFLFMLMSGILGIVIGHRFNNAKIIKSICIGFMIYTALSTVSLAVLYVIGLINPNIMDIFKNEIVSSEAMKSTLYIGTSIYGIYNLILYFVTKNILNKGVNVD